MTDPIADLLTRIRNGQMARNATVIAGYSKIKAQILQVLKQGGFILDFSEKKDAKGFKILEIQLDANRELTLKRVSKAGQRIYFGRDEIKKVLNGYGIAILSTSKGIISNTEARKQGIGGELLCEVF